MSITFKTKEEIEKHVHLNQTEVVVELDLMEKKDREEALNGLAQYFSISPSLGNTLLETTEVKMIMAEPLGSWLKMDGNNSSGHDIINYVYNLLN